ncbi:MAG: metallophosphoesterase [Deltaproteobacteria bacterium]|nr:metallophosphoesterase [Deltaproteobacteria bacterium]
MTAIAHISDPHFGTENPAVLDALLGDLKGLRPSLVALSGDLTQRARTAQFRAARAFLDELQTPYLVVPGNHDVPLYNVVRRFFDPLGSYRNEITDDLAPTFNDDKLAVAGISTAHGFTAKGGRITSEQIGAATTSLATANGKWKVIVAHHPFVGPERAQGDIVDGAEPALVAFRTAGVHMILTGHLHVSFTDDAAMRDEGHRIINVHAGTCMSTRTREEPNNYNRILFDGDEVTVLVRMWNGTAFVDGDHKVYRRSAVAGREIRKQQ